MKQFKKIFALLLAMCLMLGTLSACGSEAAPAATEAAPEEAVVAEAVELEPAAEETAAEEAVAHYSVGDKIEDFTVTTYDGKEVNLYKVLEEKDMVLLNLWATWCGPCGAEFPAIQEAYEQYKDKVEIIALSTSATDSDEVLAEYVKTKGMTFPVARDTVNMSTLMNVIYIPTSVVVDRFGTICVISSGGEPEASVFVNLFEIYTAEEYTESLFMPSLSAKIADAEPADPAELNAAVNVEGGNLVFTNNPSKFYWPMIVEQVDGRTVASASNADATKSLAALETQVEAEAGDVLAMEYKLGSLYNLSVMRLTVDGEDVKVNSLGHDWTTTYYQFEESGTHDVTIRFERDIDENEGSEGLWIDSIYLLSGDEAAEAMANKQQYPVGNELRIDILGENVKTAAFVQVETNAMVDYALISDEPTLLLEVELPEDADPESAFLYDVYGETYPLISFVNGDVYQVEVPNAALSADFAVVYLFFNGEQKAGNMAFASLDQANKFAVDMAPALGMNLKAVWMEEVADMAEASVGDGSYTVTYVDQNGDPVPGVMCQVCDENTCQVFVSDANGVCEFTLGMGNYEIHTLQVPAGYEGDTTTITEAPVGGGELTFILTKK